MEPTSIIDLALMSIIVLVFLLPLIFKQVGGNLEAFLFLMALILLGNGLEVVIDKYLIEVPPQILYWVNILSAVLDNATLTAAEITPSMSLEQIKAMLIGLLISGGILIPGNIANIVSADKLPISSFKTSFYIQFHL